MDSINGITIDGKTEIDDLALVMHIANQEHERLCQLESTDPIKPRRALKHQSDSSGSDSDDSGSETYNEYRQFDHFGDATADASVDKEYHPVIDPDFPIDNIRIVDTVDLPERVADHFPIAPIGRCVSTVGRVAVIQCTDPATILDLGSIVCLQDRRIVGTVSDTFGNTVEPFHMVICSDPGMLRAGDIIFYDVKHSTLVSDLNVAETASNISSEDDSDEDCNPKCPDTTRKAVKLKQYYNDLETH
ncbi:snoRNP assembly factor, putative [Babesia ovis]|uniref:H/ACA ribonucleoprotein complex subunit n=1 Tax=Babesia ovis TaxID=5869 RepID=A0A9W5TB25_BABOV|nr:snoRNP assembly factor, putative [Babesia ovis]